LFYVKLNIYFFFLGIIIDDRLQLKDHCDYMLKKVGKKTSFLNRMGNFISYTRCSYIRQS